jgi:hypothetical protein
MMSSRLKAFFFSFENRFALGIGFMETISPMVGNSSRPEACALIGRLAQSKKNLRPEAAPPIPVTANVDI